MSGNVLLDTSIVIGLFASDPTVIARLSQADEIFIPSVVLGELYFGAYKWAHPDQHVRRIEELISTSTVLVCDAATAALYGRIKKALREKNKPLPENDIWIVALAQQHNLTVVSRDPHFKEIENLSIDVW